MNSVVLVIGEGMLADFVFRDLSTRYQVVRLTNLQAGVPETTDLALVLHDAWQPSIHHKAEEVFQPANIPWIRGFVSFGEGVVGPLVRSGTPGCSRCADKRRLMAGIDRKEMWELEKNLSHERMPHDAWASRTGLLQVAHLLVAETQRVLKGRRAHLEGRVFLINLKTLKSSRHFFLPDPECPICSRLPDDSPIAARITLSSSPKISIDSYRCRSMHDLKEVLVKDYLDYRTGLLNGKMHDLMSPFADASVNLPLLMADEGSAGRTHSYAESELTAILEGLERYCGLTPRGKRTVIHDSYHNLTDQALDPVKAGVHAEEQYERSGFPFKPFDPDRPIEWVWGYSLLEKRPILVPKLLAYYSLCGGGDGFVYETSNGCALGGSLVEAIFYGILEVIERDSFLITWYAQLPIPRLDPSSANDREVRLMVDRLKAVAGYDLYLFNATMENGIPSIWAVAKNRRSKGANIICAAGSHPNPVRAVKSAIHELAGMMPMLEEKFEANREKYEQMLHDPFLVQQMEDHSMLYSLPQSEERLQFLLDENRPLRTFDEEFKRVVKHADLTDDLKDILQVFHRLNLDVIVVDQTTPEIRRNGLHCVKVLIPGMLPMTFGHHFTRVTGLKRVLQVPVKLGYAKETLSLEQLNPHPHPFP